MMSFPVINSVVWRRFPSQIRDDSRRHGHGAFVIDGHIPRSRKAPAKRIAETGDLRKMDRNAVSRVSHWGHAISATHGRSSRNAFARRGVGGGEGGGGREGGVELDRLWIGRIRDAFRRWAVVLLPADAPSCIEQDSRAANRWVGRIGNGWGADLGA